MHRQYTASGACHLEAARAHCFACLQCHASEGQVCCKHLVLVVDHCHRLTHSHAAGISCPPIRGRQQEILCAQRHNDPQASGRDQVSLGLCIHNHAPAAKHHVLATLLVAVTRSSSKVLDYRAPCLRSAREVGIVSFVLQGGQESLGGCAHKNQGTVGRRASHCTQWHHPCKV